MIRWLTRNADHRREFGIDSDADVPAPSRLDRCSVRLGALLHDIGHGSFSHVTEAIIRDRHTEDFERAEAVLRETFEGVTRIATSETVATLIVLSSETKKVFEHPAFGAVTNPAQLAPAIAARILGSRTLLGAGYLSGVISGPLDADKLDYMARDSHYTGLPTGIDVNRLISKLEVVVVTTDNAPNHELRQRAIASGRGRFYEMGISLAGLGAYEQMIIARVILYDRVYYHHKVRAAESMVRRLIGVVEEEPERSLQLKAFFAGIPDDAMISVLGGELLSGVVKSGGTRANRLAVRLRDRTNHLRAFAFASRFIGGLDDLPIQEKQDTRALLWNAVLKALLQPNGCEDFASRIFEAAKAIAVVIPELRESGEGLSPDDVLVDLPEYTHVARGGDILTRTHSGSIGNPNLFFDPEKWSQAYEDRKQCGFVFAPREHVPLVVLASKVVFCERFQAVMTSASEEACKTVRLIRHAWIDEIAKYGLCSADSLEQLTSTRPRFVPIRREELRLPPTLVTDDPNLKARLSEQFATAAPSGFVASVHDAIVNAIEHMAHFLIVAEQGGYFVNEPDLPERELQARLRDHLRAREIMVHEGSEVGGGETDLVLPGPLVVENKVAADLLDPMASGPHYAWQARRYSMAVSTRVGFVLLAYRPRDERAILPLSDRITVCTLPGASEGFVQVRFAVPYAMASRRLQNGQVERRTSAAKK
jgi:hypothetical protein